MLLTGKEVEKLDLNILRSNREKITNQIVSLIDLRTGLMPLGESHFDIVIRSLEHILTEIDVIIGYRYRADKSQKLKTDCFAWGGCGEEDCDHCYGEESD